MHRIRPLAATALFGLLLTLGDRPEAAPTAAARGRVVVYAALDQDFSEPILRAYGESAGVDVLPKFDVESTKTVGLTNLIMAEARRPRCDLFWNNEILNTLRLKRRGLLEPIRPANAADYSAEFRSPDGTWYGFAARARILLVNTRLVPEEDRPAGIEALADPRWKGKVGFAKPLFGTTATHAACLWDVWGEDRTRQFFRAVKANDAQVLAGNKQVALAVSKGDLAIGWTDTDDAMAEVDAGNPVAIVYPDQGEGGLGTLFIPNTLAVIKGAPNRAEAEALADFLLRPEVEAQLARGPSAQIPLNRKAEAPARVETPRTVRAMAIDFEAAADAWDRAAAFLAEEFAGR